MMTPDHIRAMVIAADRAPDRILKLTLRQCYPEPRGPMKLRVTKAAPRDVDDDAFFKALEVSGLVALHEQCWPTEIAQAQ